MTDPIQASSTIPLPEQQTVRGSHDPLPQPSVEWQNRIESESADDKLFAQHKTFDDYLSQSSISNALRVQAEEATPVYDVVNTIRRSNTYLSPDGTKPL